MNEGTLLENAKKLIKETAMHITENLDAWLEEIETAGLGPGELSKAAPDPELRAGNIRTTRSNATYWLIANIARPGEPVAPNLSEEVLEAQRNLVRRGRDVDGIDGYRYGQNAAWKLWMKTLFSLTTEISVAALALEITAETIANFIDQTEEAVEELVRQEKDQLLQGSQVAKRDMIERLVAGEQVSIGQAERILSYILDGRHTAGIVWSTASEPDSATIAATVRDVCAHLQATRYLSVVASAGTVWFWADTSNNRVSDRIIPTSLQLAMGNPSTGEEGFRRSHLEALTVQRMLGRTSSNRRSASITDVALTNVITIDLAAADEYLRSTLGDLMSAEPATWMLLRTYLLQQSSIARTADAMHMHRNTVIRGLAKAKALLPRHLDHDPIGIAAALDVLYWRG